MYRLLTAVATIIIAANCAPAQEFTDLRSADLLKRLTERFAAASAHSVFLDNYAEENAKFGTDVKSVKVKRDEYYECETLLEKGFVIAKTETTPFVKTVETFNIDHKGRLCRSSKRTARISGDEVLREETDIASFAYGDTLHELHNFHASPHSGRCDFSFTYVIDSLGRTTAKVSETAFSIDTTHYDYYPNGLLQSEARSGKVTIAYHYQPDGKVASITRRNTDGAEVHFTTFSYDTQGRLASVHAQENGSQSILNLRYDAKGNLVWVASKNDDTAEECAFEYDDHGYICTDCRGFAYKYKYDKRGNWVKCDISRGGRRVERISREFVYTKH